MAAAISPFDHRGKLRSIARLEQGRARGQARILTACCKIRLCVNAQSGQSTSVLQQDPIERLAPYGRPRGLGAFDRLLGPRSSTAQKWLFLGHSGPPKKDPREIKKPKKLGFFYPCGKKSGGSGGAPPTHLILLRNQRSPEARTRPRRTHAPPVGRGPPGVVGRG